MDRHIGARYGSSPDSHPSGNSRGPPSHSSDSSPINHHHRRSPNNYPPGGLSGGGRDHRPFHSPPRYPLGRGGFRPMGGLGGVREFISPYEVPLSGQKREFPFSDRGGSPDHFDRGSFDKKNFDGGSYENKNFDGGSFAKLFVGSVPRTATEDDIRPLFEEHGHVVEVALIKDKRTGQQQGPLRDEG